MTYITSPANPKIKAIRALRQRKERERTGCFFVEGVQALTEAANARAAIQTLVLAPELFINQHVHQLAGRLRANAASVVETSAEVFTTLAAKEVVPGIAAVVRQQWHPLGAVERESGCWVALDAVQYPGNLGTILRTSEAVGGAGIILIGNTSDPYDPACTRASVGAIFTQRLVRTDIHELAAWKQATGIAVVGTSPAARHDYRVAAYRMPLVLLMGCERSGLSPELMSICDVLVRIPMAGKTDSLNLGVATSIMLYEVFRQQHPMARSRT